jgi:hypothetical protein
MLANRSGPRRPNLGDIEPGERHSIHGSIAVESAAGRPTRIRSGTVRMIHLGDTDPSPTDAQLLRDVVAAIRSVPGLRFSRCYIDVDDRVVTICGRVLSHAERHEAERTIRGIVRMKSLVFEVGVTSPPKVHAASQKHPVRPSTCRA